jgi:proteasome accessory factor A
MENKIRGVEQELAMNTFPSLPNSSLIHLVGMAIEELKGKGWVTNIKVEDELFDFMALNGFRVYNDMSHLELSTPSYNSSLEAVVYDKVAELFSFYACQGLKKYFKEINVYKNNVSSVQREKGIWSSVAYSTHSSIIMDRATCNHSVWDKLEAALIPFMVTRIPLIGGGDFVPDPKNKNFSHIGKEISSKDMCYTISPRSMFIKKLSSNDTVEVRGLLNQRDDPHADNKRFWRLHDINWEGLRSPFQIYLRDSLEVLVMMAYEGGFLNKPPKLEDPIRAIKKISVDIEECKWNVILEGNKKVDALSEIMEGFYLAGIEEMMDERETTQVDRMSFKLIEGTLQGLGERRLEYFLDGLDWVTKKALIDEYAPNDVEEAIGICNQYTLLDEGVLKFVGENENTSESYSTFNVERSIDFARDAIPIVEWDALEKKITNALTYGPENTREYFRCLSAREFPFLANSIKWESVNLYNASIRLDDPFMFNKEMCGDILEKSTGTLDSFMQAIYQIDSEGKSILYDPVDDEKGLHADDETGGA